MTAPAIAPTAPAAPVVAPTTPTAPVETQTPQPEQRTSVARAEHAVQNEAGGIDALISKISRKVTPQALTDAPLGGEAPESSPPADGSVLAQPTTPPAETATAQPTLVSEVSIDTPNGKMTLRARDPNTGQFVTVDSSLKFDLAIPTEDGASKVYESKSMSDVLRLAQDGLNMQKARGELKYYRENVGTWQKGHEGLNQQIATAKQEGEGWQALAISLLTEAPEWVDQRRSAYAKQFTPENELARAKARIAELEAGPQTTRQQRPPAEHTPPAQQQVAQVAVDPALVQGFAQRVSSAVSEVEGLVGKEAAAGHIALMTAPLLVNGQLPPNRFAAVEQYVNGPFREWAKAEAAKRQSADALTQQAQAELAKAREIQARAQQAARNVGTASRPNAVTSGTQAPQRPKPNNVRDMVDHIARRPSPAQTGSLLAG